MEQCTVLNKSVRYGDVDFVLKAETGLRVFQNRGFRQTHDFKNPLLGGPSREQNQIVYRPIAFNRLVATASGRDLPCAAKKKQRSDGIPSRFLHPRDLREQPCFQESIASSREIAPPI